MKVNGGGIMVPARVLFACSMLGIQLTGFAQGADRPQISLDECVERAIQQNLAKHARQFEFEIATWGVQRERATFEPMLVGSARQEENRRENTVEQFRNQLTSSFEEDNRRYDLGMEGQFYSGARYRLGYTLNDLSNNLTNNVVTTPFDHEFQSFLGATVTQPLLRGGGLAAAMAGVNLARALESVEFHNLRREMMSVAAQTEASFWDLALAEHLVTIRQNSVTIAERILEDNRERNRQGKMSETEVLQAEVGLEDRSTRLSEARQQRVLAMSQLRRMFSEDASEPPPAIVTTGKERVAPFPHAFEAAMELATQLQPDYRAQLGEIKQSDIRLAYAKNQRWPQLDLVGSYGYNGLGADVSDSWDEASGGDYDAWAVGLQLSIGLGGDRKVRSELQMARLRQMQSLTRLKEVEISIVHGLQSGIEECASLMENLERIARIASVRERLLDVELERLEAGRSDSRSVLAVEEDLLLAKEAAARSLNEYRKALLRTELAAGLTLLKHGLDPLPREGGAAAATPEAPEPTDSASTSLETPVPRAR